VEQEGGVGQQFLTFEKTRRTVKADVDMDQVELRAASSLQCSAAIALPIGISAALALGGCYRRRSWRPDMKFADRSDAGRRLAGKLMHFKERRPVILALPRGGVAIGFEIAQALGAPLDIVLVRKIGVPWEPELAVGAVTDGATPETFIDWDLAADLEVPESYLEEERARQLAEIERRRETYCADRPPAEIREHTAIVVDDGIATGATMRVALRAMRSRGPSHLVVAVPVAPPDTLAELSKTADETVCLETPIGLGAIGFYYRDFHQMTDAEVTELLARAAATELS
jgi:putative phosphoribosyl transferase